MGNAEIADNSPCELDSEGCPQGEAKGRIKKARSYSYFLSRSCSSDINSLMSLNDR